MSEIKASIIIPCYNAEKWIEQTIMSALNQTHSNIEVIIVDNESTDGSRTVVGRIAENNSKIILDTAENIYPYCWDEAREKGFSLAEGKYFFTLAADDLLHTNYVESCLKYFNNGKIKIHALQSAIKSVDASNNFLGDINHNYHDLQDLKKMLLVKCPVNSPTVVYDRELYDKGLLKTDPATFSGAADYDLYCSLVDKDYFIYPTGRWIGYYYRWHKDQATWQMHKEETSYDNLIQEKWSEKWKI